MTDLPSDDAAHAFDNGLVDAEADSVPTPAAPPVTSAAARVLLGVSLVLIAFNLRPVFSSASEKSLPKAPVSVINSASAPVIGPGPKARTKNSAQIKLSMPRRKSKKRFTT